MMSVLWFVLLCIYVAQSLEAECSSTNPCNSTLLCPDNICILNCQGDSSCVWRIIECTNTLTNGTCTINCNGIDSCDNITIYSNTNTILNCNNESSCNVGEIIINASLIDDINLEINCNRINSCTDINVTTFDKTDVLFNCNRTINTGNVCINNTINCGGMNNICNASCDANDCWRNTINNCDNNICSGFNHNIKTTTMIPMTTNNIITTETPMNTDATIKAAKIYQRFEEFYRYGYNWLQSQSWIIIGIICGGFGLLLCCCLGLCFYAESRKTKKLVRSLHMMGMVPSMVLNKAAKENRRVSKKIEQIEMVDADDFHDSSDDDNNGANGPGIINGNNNINNNVIMNDPDRSPVYNPLVSPSVNSDREIEIQKMNQEIERKKREQQKAFDNPHTKKMLLIMQGSKALKQLEQQNQQQQKLKNVASNSSGGMNSNENGNENENEISITLENVEDNGNNVDKPGQSSALEIFDVIPPMNTETEIELNDYNESNNNNPKAKSLRKLDKSARIPKEDSLLPNQKSVKNVNKQNNANIDDNPFSDLQMPSNSFNDAPKPPKPPIIPSNDNDVIKSADEDGILFGLMSANQDITDLNNITKDIDKPIDDFKELDKSHIKHVSVPDEDQFKIVGTKENIIITDNNGISKQYVSTKQLNVDGTTNLESAMNEAKMQSQMEQELRQQELERERINEQKNKKPVPNPLDSMPAPPSGPVITEFDDNPPSYDDIVNDKPPSYNDFLGMKPPPTGPVNVDNNDILNNINIQNGDQVNVYENGIIDDGDNVVSYQNNQIIKPNNNDVVSPLDALMNAAQPSPLNDVIQASNTVPINDDNNNTDNNDDSDSDGGFVVKQASEVNIESSDSEIDIKKTNLSNIGNGGAQYKSPFSDNDNVQTYKSPLDSNYSESDSSDDPERNVKPMFKSQAYNNEYNNNENNSDAGTEQFNPDAGYGTDPNNYSN